MPDQQTAVAPERRLPLARLRAIALPRREGLRLRLGYAALSVPLAAVYTCLFAGLVLAVVTIVQGVGLLIFLAVLCLARALGGPERSLTRRLLDVDVDEGVRLRRQPGVMAKLRGLLSSPSTWRTMAWLAVRTLMGAAVFAAVASGVGATVAMLTGTPLAASGDTGILEETFALAVVVVIWLAVLRVADLSVRVVTAVAPGLLGVSPEERIEVLRETSQRLVERNSVARDLHDTIGHTLTASLLQASAARRTLEPDPERPEAPLDAAFARQAIEHIEDNTRAALAELDRALAVLGDRSGAATLVNLPAADLRDVAGLVSGLRDGGLPVALTLEVHHADVPPPLSQLAYRIVQEGTTNVLRHAGTPPTVIEVRRVHPGDLLVRVRNGPPTRRESRPGPGGGHGMEGLRERVVAAGGTLEAEPTDQGGFELRATMPVRIAND